MRARLHEENAAFAAGFAHGMFTGLFDTCRESEEEFVASTSLAPSKTSMLDTVGFPLGESAGFIYDKGVNFGEAFSSASALRTSTPTCAPRPTATMMDIGVARPSAQGQAMISTEHGRDPARAQNAAPAKQDPACKEERSRNHTSLSGQSNPATRIGKSRRTVRGCVALR